MDKYLFILVSNMYRVDYYSYIYLQVYTFKNELDLRSNDLYYIIENNK